jgi:methionine aminotransferase
MQIETKLPKVGTTIFTVMSQLATEHKAVNLGQGFPDFDGPQALRDALTRAMNEGRNQYAPMTGLPVLREQIARKTERLYGRKVSADSEVTVTSGATEALFAAIAAIVRAGDEVIVLDPCYDSYEPAIELNGGRAVHVPLDPRDFSPDWQRIKEAITRKTRMIMINTPHNPCGSVFSAADLDTLATLLRGTEILVLSDEVYEHIVFDGAAHQSVLRHAELAERSFVVSSFGKTYHCTGWKVGYCIAPRTLSAEFRKVHQYLTFCTFTPAQVALAEVLDKNPQHYLDLPTFYQAKRDHFRDLLAGSKFRLLPVGGAYFQVADYSALSSTDDLSFCEWLVKEGGVAAIPISAFYETPPTAQRLIRFCFAKNDATLEQAATRLKAL